MVQQQSVKHLMMVQQTTTNVAASTASTASTAGFSGQSAVAASGAAARFETSQCLRPPLTT